MFREWQSLIKTYRAGGSSNEKDEGQDEDETERSDEQDDDGGLVSAAHYDVMSEVITKLLANRPSWIDDSGANDFQVSRQKLIEATQFIDYDKIDQVEREEEDTQQIMIQESQGEGANLGSQVDTLESQSRVQSKDNYLPQIHKMNILEKLELIFEQNLQRDIYDTMHNHFKIQINDQKKQETQLKEQKQESDQLLKQEESLSGDGQRFKEEFDSKLQSLARELNLKTKEVEQTIKIRELESLKSKEQLQGQCEEKDDEIVELQQKVNNLNEKLNAATEEYVKTEQAKNLEISHY